jgi:D-alanyl-D-alanine carboxypeptidase/D-alanyl-D-alanine carboxypeptidase (penicillin-binding protein 5/6)
MQINDTGVRYEVPVVGGLQDNVMVAGTQAEDITIKNEDSARIVRTVEMPPFVYAPVRNGQVLGRICYTLDGETLALTDLIAVRDVDAPPIKKNFFERAFDTIKGLFGF